MKALSWGLLLVLWHSLVLAQPNFTKTIDAKQAKHLSFSFDYPKQISLTTWEGNQILIEGEVVIDGGKRNDVFVIDYKWDGNKLQISNKLDIQAIPEKYFAENATSTVVFDSKEELDAYLALNPNETFKFKGQSRDIKIILNIKVPKSKATELNSGFGEILVKNFEAPLKVNAMFGVIDAVMDPKHMGELSMATKFGKLYTNIDLQDKKVDEKLFDISIHTNLGKGMKYDFNAVHGNIYLRDCRTN